MHSHLAARAYNSSTFASATRCVNLNDAIAEPPSPPTKPTSPNKRFFFYNCPVFAEPSTVHSVGKLKLIATVCDGRWTWGQFVTSLISHSPNTVDIGISETKWKMKSYGHINIRSWSWSALPMVRILFTFFFFFTFFLLKLYYWICGQPLSWCAAAAHVPPSICLDITTMAKLFNQPNQLSAY